MYQFISVAKIYLISCYSKYFLWQKIYMISKTINSAGYTQGNQITRIIFSKKRADVGCLVLYLDFFYLLMISIFHLQIVQALKSPEINPFFFPLG